MRKTDPCWNRSHLLLTRPSESTALENFILSRCSSSVHIALITLWHLQSTLSDLSHDPKTASFQTCRRVINHCQKILFDDSWEEPPAEQPQLEPVASSSSTTLVASGHSSRFPHKLLWFKVRRPVSALDQIHPGNMRTTLVGLGSALGSAPGMPLLVSVGGQMAIDQGRKLPDEAFRRMISRIEDDGEDWWKEEEEEEDQVGDTNEEEPAEGEVDTSPAAKGKSPYVHAQQPSSDQSDAAEQESAGEASSHKKATSSIASAELPAVKEENEKVEGDKVEGVPPALPPKDLNGAQADDKIHRGPPSSARPSTESPLPPTPNTAISTASQQPQKSPNPFMNFASSLNQFKDRAAAAVGNAVGQHFQIVAPPNATSPIKPHHRSYHPPGTPASSSSPRSPSYRPSQKRPAAPSTKSEAILRSAAAAAHSQSVPDLPQGARFGLNGSSSSTAALPSFSPSSSSVDSLALAVSLYAPQARARLLRVHYSRTQTDFLALLQDISARLLLLPKPARLSALRAELTQLNHSLPKEVCFPLWCKCTRDDAPGQRSIAATTPTKQRHHRVVRINPSEAVVLNSADRVPFLLHVEVLDHDLDFDPDRRANRETLKKLIAREQGSRKRRGIASAATGAGSVTGLGVRDESTAPASGARHPPAPPSDTPKDADGGLVAQDASSQGFSSRPGSGVQTPLPVELKGEHGDGGLGSAEENDAGDVSSLNMPDEGEGIDLTEQMYGADLAKFGGDGGDDSDDDLAVINRRHDAEVWGGRASGAGRSSISAQPESPTANKRQNFSLDDYSERMRTAAIMLAQLNQSTNAAAQPIVTHNPHVTATAQGGWSSWIIGTSWAANNPASTVAPKSEPGQGSAGIKAAINGITLASPATAGANGPGVPPLTPKTPSMQIGGGGGTGAGKLVHADAEGIRKRIMQEMMALEEERMSRTKVSSRVAVGSGIEDEATVMKAVNKDDPSAAIFRESWAAKKARIRASSPYGHLPNWDVFSVIVKTGADLRQEQLAVQLINEFSRIFAETQSRCWVRYFRILVTSENSGLMETITDAISIHSIKKEAYTQQVGGEIATYSLYDHFTTTHGHPNSGKFKRAQDRFMVSLAGYSIISYLLQIKDRHNGNILVDDEGHLIHIDFGFMLGISPGGVGFEAAPFKMPQEYIDILGGVDGPKFQEFRQLMRQGFKDVRKHAERIIMIVELMQKGEALSCCV